MLGTKFLESLQESEDMIRPLVGVVRGEVESPPISESDIRRWAVAVYWPQRPPRRFFDASWSATSVWGAVTAPEELNPFAWMVDGVGELPTRPDFMRTRRSLSAGNEAWYYAPIHPGDVITGTDCIVDVYHRSGRNADLMFIVGESRMTNQRGELVKVFRHPWVHVFDRGDETIDKVMADLPQRREIVPPILEHQENTETAEVPGPSFNDISAGVELPVFKRYTDLGNFTRYSAVSEDFNYQHFDADVARFRGQHEAFGQGALQFSYLHILLRQWMGERGAIRHIACQYRLPNFKGDTVTCRGKISRCYREGDQQLVDLDIWVENQDGEVTSPGEATVAFTD